MRVLLGWLLVVLLLWLLLDVVGEMWLAYGWWAHRLVTLGLDCLAGNWCFLAVMLAADSRVRVLRSFAVWLLPLGFPRCYPFLLILP